MLIQMTIDEKAIPTKYREGYLKLLLSDNRFEAIKNFQIETKASFQATKDMMFAALLNQTTRVEVIGNALESNESNETLDNEPEKYIGTLQTLHKEIDELQYDFKQKEYLKSWANKIVREDLSIKNIDPERFPEEVYSLICNIVLRKNEMKVV